MILKGVQYCDELVPRQFLDLVIPAGEHQSGLVLGNYFGNKGMKFFRMLCTNRHINRNQNALNDIFRREDNALFNTKIWPAQNLFNSTSESGTLTS